MEALSEEYGWLPSDIMKQDYMMLMEYWSVLQLKRKLKNSKNGTKRANNRSKP